MYKKLKRNLTRLENNINELIEAFLNENKVELGNVEVVEEIDNLFVAGQTPKTKVKLTVFIRSYDDV